MAANQCLTCGWSHEEDYSDVLGTAQEWIYAACSSLKAQGKRLRHLRVRDTGKAVAVKVRTPDGEERAWVTTEGGEHKLMEEMQRDADRAAALAERLPLRVKFIRVHGHAEAPRQAYKWDAGFDLALCEEALLEPGKWQNLRTGIVAAIPEGYWGHILARSSTWRHLSIRVEPAVIDSSYRGELMVYAVSTLPTEQRVMVGQRLAQIIVVPLPNVEWLEQMDLPPGERGDRGYGSSG